MTSRAEYGVTYTQNWNEDNKLSSVTSNGASTTFSYDADGNRIKKTETGSVSFSDAFGGLDTASWSYNTNYHTIVDDGGGKVLRTTGDNAWRAAYRNPTALSHGKSMVVDFKLDNVTNGAHFVIEDGVNSRFGLIAYPGGLQPHYYINGGQWTTGTALLSNPQAHVWYRLTINVNDSSGFVVDVRQRDNPAVGGSATVAMPAGRAWRFINYMYNLGTYAWLDNYIERNNATLTTVYIGGYFEKEIVSAAPPTNPPSPTAIPTSTPPPAATATPTPSGGCAVLDCFTTSLSSNWMGDTGSFTINSAQLVAAVNQALYWNASYSGDVWASIKLGTLSSGQVVALHLRAVNNYWTNGVIEVGYTQGSGVTIYTFDGSSWVSRGTLSASFANGDVFKAASSASGTVTVYKNGTSIGSANVSGWSGYNRNGQIGLWTDAGGALLDDFDGGGGGATSTPTPTPTPGGGSNLAPSGTGYRWSQLGSPTSNSNKVAAPGINDGNTTADVKLNAGANDTSNAYEAGGVTWASAQTIGTIKFIGGSFDNSGSATQNNGPFAANLQAQYTTDGSTWVNTGWTATPSYPYDSASTEGQTYVFTGTPINNVTGVRVVGQVHTATSNSWEASVREVMAYAAQNASLLGGRKVWAKGHTKPGERTTQPVAQQQGLGSVTVRQYYFFNGRQVAMRVCNGGCSAGNPGAVYFLHGDHLGSASLTTSNAGAKTSEARYTPFGEMRYQWSNMPTDKRYTGQRWEGALGSVYDYNARLYNPLTAKFLSADSIVPDGDKASMIPLTVDFHEPGFLAAVNGENAFRQGLGMWFQLKDKTGAKTPWGPSNPQQLNRYAYALGNPIRFNDPTGHDVRCSQDYTVCTGGRVVNLSKHDVRVRGDFLLNDGTIVNLMML